MLLGSKLVSCTCSNYRDYISSIEPFSIITEIAGVIKMDDCCMGEPDNNSDYNLIVLGAGSAGFSASITAADQGAKVAMIGHGTIGGTCVNVGCVPSKTLIRASEALHQSREASRFGGISAQATVDDWRQTAKLKDDARVT